MFLLNDVYINSGLLYFNGFSVEAKATHFLFEDQDYIVCIKKWLDYLKNVIIVQSEFMTTEVLHNYII